MGFFQRIHHNLNVSAREIASFIVEQWFECPVAEYECPTKIRLRYTQYVNVEFVVSLQK